MRAPGCWWRRFFRGDPCAGRYHRCHIGFTKQFLRAQGLGEGDVWDERVVRHGCSRHHERSHWATFHLRRCDLPPSVEQFARDHGLTWRLDRDYGPVDRH